MHLVSLQPHRLITDCVFYVRNAVHHLDSFGCSFLHSQHAHTANTYS
jgi:hypothetical protein